MIAGEQSSGTFVAGARRDAGAEGALGGAGRTHRRCSTGGGSRCPGRPTPKHRTSRYTRACSTLSWPIENLGPSLPNLMATVAGNLFELQHCHRPAAARPPAAAQPSPRPIRGPQFGVDGTRRLAGVDGRPLIGTIIKPSVGLSPEETAAAGARARARPASTSSRTTNCSPTARTVRSTSACDAVMRVINDHAERTGKKVMFAFNLTGDLDQMRRRHDLVVDARRHLRDGEPQFGRPGRHDRTAAPCATADPCAPQRLGLSVAASGARLVLRRRGRRSGVSRARTTCTSTASRNKFSEPDDSVIASARALLTPMFDAKPCDGDAGVLLRPNRLAGRRHLRGARLDRSDLYRRRRHHGASGGPGGRRRALREAWEAAMAACRSPRAPPHPALAGAWSSGDEQCGATARRPPARLLRRRLHRLDRRSMEAMTVRRRADGAVPRHCRQPNSLRAFRHARCIGIAGIVARSQTPNGWSASCRRSSRRSPRSGRRSLHYKVCSTFDSSPTSARSAAPSTSACAIHAGPLVAAASSRAPRMGRYQAFGNLFAAVDGAVYRLDRHPTMSRHPVTPMDEADLRLHLARQTSSRSGSSISSP